MALTEDFTLTSTPDRRDDIDDAVGLVVDVLRTLPLKEAVMRASRYQSQFVALEAELFARNRAGGASDRNNEDLAGRGKTTTRADAKKRAKRGAAVNNNPELANDLAQGQLGTEQVDAIADASAKTSGDAARDRGLLDDIKRAAPDEAKDIAKAWVDEHNHPDGDGADKRHDRQRRLREAKKFPTKDGCTAILIKGDDESINEIWSNMNAAAKKLWRKDGGRDVKASKHPRTRAQRLFDAAHQKLTNTADSSIATGSGSGSGSAAKTTSGTTLFLWQNLQDFLAGKHNATFANGQLVPQTVLSRYMCGGTIAGIVFDKNGEVLWTGREHRLATPAILRGLMARDKGCVLCLADISECEAHHLIPWNSPGKGETNIDGMVMVCTDCHHFIHDTNQTLYKDQDGRWKLRPATPEETPPQHNHQKQ